MTGKGLKDGVYGVTTRYLSAGFVVEHGQVTRCAPILRKNIQFWIALAVYEGPLCR